MGSSRAVPYPPRTQTIAFTLRSRNIFIRSDARSRSLPASNPHRRRTFAGNFGLNPNRSSASTERSIALGSGGALAGAMMPIVSPGFRRGGLIGTARIRAAFLAFGYRLPQLDPVSFWICNPRKTSVIVIFNFFDFDTAPPKLFQHSLQVSNDIVDHERGFRLTEIICIRFKDRPDRSSRLIRPVLRLPGKIGVSVLRLDSKIRPVPRRERLRV